MSRIEYKSMDNIPLILASIQYPFVIIDDVDGSMITEDKECEVVESKKLIK